LKAGDILYKVALDESHVSSGNGQDSCIQLKEGSLYEEKYEDGELRQLNTGLIRAGDGTFMKK
jgi:hypothetical protein